MKHLHQVHPTTCLTFLRESISSRGSEVGTIYLQEKILPKFTNSPKFMKNIVSVPLVLLLLLSTVLASMAEEGGAGIEKKEEATVHIVYVDRPEDADPEEFHIRTLGSVLGSEEAAKEAVLYHYKTAARGFSAKLTPSQVEELKKQPGVLQVVPSQTYQLHGTGPAGGTHRVGAV